MTMQAEAIGVALLQQCWRAGITLSLNDGALRFKAPAGAMTPVLLGKIKDNKPLLIEALTQNPDYFDARPLSINERALWFMYRMNPQSSAYNMAYAIKINSAISDVAITQAFTQLVKLHPILSGPYSEREGEPLQWLNRSSDAQITVVHQTQATQSDIDQCLALAADKPLQIENGEVCRAQLLLNSNGAEQESYLLMVVHHIAADFMSFEVLRQDFLALLDDPALLLEKGEYTYQDWSAEQQQLINDAKSDKQYWLDALGDVPQLQLPTDFLHSADLQAEGEEISFELTPQRAKQLRSACKQLSVTPYVWWLSAFQWFLGRVSGQDDFVIGTPSAGRFTPEHARLVGYLVNPLVLRCQMTNEQSFDQWVQQTNQQVKQSLAHQRYPFARLVEDLNVKREAGRSAVFQHMFTLNHDRIDDVNDAVIDAQLLAEQRGAAHELNLVVVDDRQKFAGKWRYNNGLYRRETVERLREGFVYFVEQLLDNGQAMLSDVLLYSDQLASCVSDELSLIGSNKFTPPNESAWQCFIDQCALTPDANAIERSGQFISYQALLELVDQWAEVLTSSITAQPKSNDLNSVGAVSEQCRIGICLQRSVEQIALMLASWKLQAAYVAMDTQWPEQRLNYISDDASVVVVVGVGERPEWLNESSAWIDVSAQAVSQLEPSVALTKREAISELPTTDASLQTAYIIYTSGSTGKPKGVAVSQRNVAYYTSAMMQRLTVSANASMASLASSGADLGYTAIFGALLTGRCLRLLDESLALDADALADALAAHPVDCLKIVPSHLNGLLLACKQESLLPREALITGGEALSAELLDKIWQRHDTLRVFNHYGPTETTVGAVMLELPKADYHCCNDSLNAGATTSIKEIPLGLPLANVQARVLDTFGHAVIPGFSGELHIGGPTVAQGYVGAFAKKALASDDLGSVPSFYHSDEQHWYKTGDKVKIQNGQLYFLGRCDFQVKIRGYRVEPAEVESWLKRYVDDALVVNAPNQSGHNRLVAYVVSDAADDVNAVRGKMQQALPDYMVPSTWVSLDALPLTSNGKVDRHALPDPDSVSSDADAMSAQSTQPRNRVEAELLIIWQTLLANPDLGIYDNFFDQGGDSILGLQIISQARQKSITLTPKDIFDNQTIAALAAVAKTPYREIEKTLLGIAQQILGKPDLSATDNFFDVGGDSILSLQIIAKARAQGINISPKQIFEYQSMSALAEVAQQTKTKPESKKAQVLPLTPFDLTPIQKWFFKQNLASPSHWNQSLLLDAQGELNTKALSSAIGELVQTHASLRLSFVHLFVKEESHWQQVYQTYQEDWDDSLLTIEPGGPDEQTLHRVQACFDLTTGPLVRFVWFAKTQQLLCTAHHLIIDAVSWNVVLGELQLSYKTHCSDNKNAGLTESPGLFNQWQDQLAQYVSRLDVDSRTEYWLAQSQTELPSNTSDNTYANSQHYSTVLNADLTAQLLSDVHRAYNSRTQEVLLASLAQVIGQWQQIDKVTIELEGHGRESHSVAPKSTHDQGQGSESNNELDLSRSIGWFTSRYPQKLNVYSDIESALISVKEQLRRLPLNGLEYGLVRYLPKSDTVWPSHDFISFNYLGRQQASQNKDAVFSLADSFCAGSRANDNQRPHAIDINAIVVDGCLTIDWCYPTSNKAYSIIPSIADNYHQTLIDMIEHCLNPDHGRATAADFLSADLNDTQFLELLAELDV